MGGIGGCLSLLTMGRNALWLLVCRVSADLLSFALFLVISRRLGPEGVGIYAYGFAVAGLVYSATTLGIDEYGIREYTRRAPQERPLLMCDLLGAQLCMAGVTVVLLMVYLLLSQPQATTLALVLFLTGFQLCSAFAGSLFVPSMAEQDMTRPAVVMLLSRAIPMTLGGALIWSGMATLESAIAVFPVAGLIMLVLAMRSAVSYGMPLRAHLSLPVLRDGARTLWSFAAAEVITQLITRIGVIVLTLRVSEAAAGIYAAG